MEERLAKITKATLEIKDRGILNFWIFVDYEEGGSQGVGGIALDAYDKEKEQRVGTAFGCEVIRQLLLALNVNDFSEMKGKMIWVVGIGKGFDFKPEGVRPLNVDSSKNKSIIFKEILKEMK